MIGTPFNSNDDYLQRKVKKLNKKPWEQEARDEKGRRRFHGAFTGGFSAGYFNTVGSKEGWKPCAYDKKRVNPNVMDFMDEEDIQSQIGVHTITSRDEYKDVSNHVFHMSKKEAHNLPIPGGEVLLQDFLPKFNNMQNQLLIEAGFEKTESNTDGTNESKYFKGPLEFKDNYFGLGYVDMNGLNRSHITSKHISQETSRNIIKMSQFDDEPESGFYTKDDRTEYTFEENILDDEDNIRKGKRNENSGLAPSFIKSKRKLQMASDIKFQMPKLPDDYNPLQVKNKTIHKEVNNTNRHPHIKMNPERRNELIEDKREKKNFLESKFHSSKPQIGLHLKPPTGIDQISSYFNFKSDIPFKNDIAKVSRFAKFIAEKEGLIIGEGYYNVGNLMTASEIRDEKILFEKLYEEEQNLKASQDKTRTETKGNGQSVSQVVTETTREKSKWIPDKMLCKRYNVKDPYEHFAQVGEVSSLQKQIMKEEGIETGHRSNHDLKSQNNEANSQLILNTKPDVSLFDEIFGD